MGQNVSDRPVHSCNLSSAYYVLKFIGPAFVGGCTGHMTNLLTNQIFYSHTHNRVQHQTGVKAASLVYNTISPTMKNLKKKKNLEKVAKYAPCVFSATPPEKC